MNSLALFFTIGPSNGHAPCLRVIERQVFWLFRFKFSRFYNNLILIIPLVIFKNLFLDQILCEIFIMCAIPLLGEQLIPCLFVTLWWIFLRHSTSAKNVLHIVLICPLLCGYSPQTDSARHYYKQQLFRLCTDRFRCELIWNNWYWLLKPYFMYDRSVLKF